VAIAKPPAANKWLWALLVLLGVTFPTWADGPPKLGKVRVGLPSGTPDGGRLRLGTWTPIYIPLTADPTGNGQKEFKIVLEALDLEENPYRYTVPVPALAGGVTDVVIGYLRCPTQEFTVALQTLDGRTLQGPSKQQRALESEPLKPVYPLFVSIGGSSMPRLKQALLSPSEQGNAKKELPDQVDEKEIEAKLAKGYARITKVADMPDRWFGYDAVDVVILTTDNDEFMKDLTANTAAARRRALGEWVRRGGKLVLSVGRNHQLANSLLSSMPLPEVDKMPLLPFEITGSVQRKSLRNLNTWIRGGAFKPLGQDSKSGIEVAKLARGPEQSENTGLGQGADVLVAEPPSADEKDAESRPLIVQSSCGLGRVLLIAFDVDGSPFNTWQEGQVPFWRRLRDVIAPKLFNEDRLARVDNFQVREQGELEEELQRYLDAFEDVPVVSFGWVALFILLYIIVVGPLDYLVLKKVFKRLELTWVTFPTVVITISIGAYFVAYALKGDDLRVNKIDLIDIDLETPQVYGTSWFSVFSPRIQNYTFGVEPMFRSNAPAGLATAKASTTVALLENPMATPHAGSTNLFRQPYDYAEDAAGIEYLPIPVWSTRSFIASWRTPYPPDKAPIRAELVRRNDIVTGKIINELPLDLQDVCLFYKGKWYNLSDNGGGTLAARGGLFAVDNLEMGDRHGKGQQLDTWFTNTSLLAGKRLVAGTPGRRGGFVPMQSSSNVMLKTLMFFRGESTRQNQTADTTALNSGCRTLDQLWRLQDLPTNANETKYREEVILVARTAFTAGKAKPINDESLVQLWSDQLPGSADQCPPLPGFLSQEAYIRVYIPVKQ
jgi:hypothetical protein